MPITVLIGQDNDYPNLPKQHTSAKGTARTQNFSANLFLSHGLIIPSRTINQNVCLHMLPVSILAITYMMRKGGGSVGDSGPQLEFQSRANQARALNT